MNTEKAEKYYVLNIFPLLSSVLFLCIFAAELSLLMFPSPLPILGYFCIVPFGQMQFKGRMKVKYLLSGQKVKKREGRGDQNIHNVREKDYY